jgi:putative endonuclease
MERRKIRWLADGAVAGEVLTEARRSGVSRGESAVMTDVWVYMLRCRDDSLYTGWTNDLQRRLARHADGKASRYTASRLPVELAAAWPMPDRSAAMREEARIKALSRREKWVLLERFGQAATEPAM